MNSNDSKTHLMKNVERHGLLGKLCFIFVFFLILTFFGTAMAATDVNVIRNGDFNNGLDQWVVNLNLNADWKPLSSGWLSLHPPIQDFMGTIVYQNLNVSGISGKTFHFAMDMLKVSSFDGNTVAVNLVFTKSDGTRHVEQIINPLNQTISGNPYAPSHITKDYQFPDDAEKLVQIAILKKDYGEFKVNNIQLEGTGISIGNLPEITDLSTPTGAASGPYGTTLNITGINFGDTKGSITLADSNNGISVQSWSDNSITAKISDPAHSGAVRVIAGDVESDPKFRYKITSPNYTVDVVEGKKTKIKGQTAEFLFKVDFNCGFVTTNGIRLNLLSSSPALPSGVVYSFLPGSPLMEPGGIVMKIETGQIPAGEYDLTIQAQSDTGIAPQTVHCTLKIVTVSNIRFYQDTDPSKDIVSMNVSVQNEFYFQAKAIDNEGNAINDDWANFLNFTSDNPAVVQIYNGFWGPEFYAVNNGTASITATAPDGTTGTLTVNVALDKSLPIISQISLQPGSIANTDGSTSMTFSATSDKPFTWIGTNSSGMYSFNTNFNDNMTYSNGNNSVTSTFTLLPIVPTDSTLSNPTMADFPSDLGTPLFYASSGGSKRVIPLKIVNGDTTGELKGKIKILDSTFAEMYIIEFYALNDLTSPAFTREIFTIHEKSTFDIAGIPPGTYKIRIKDDGTSGSQALFSPQWYPNALTADNAKPVTLTAGQSTNDIYFFIQSIKGVYIEGAVSYGGSLLSGDVKVSAINVTQDDSDDIDAVTAYANGGFNFKNIPDGGYTLYAYIDKNGDGSYTPGEPYGYYLDSSGKTGKIIIANGNHADGIYIIIKDTSATDFTGISGTITSSLANNDYDSVAIWPHGEIPININMNQFKPDFLNPAMGIDLTVVPGSNPYEVKRYDWGNGPSIPPGNYDVVFVTSGSQNPDDCVVVQKIKQNIVVEKNKMTENIDFSVSPGATLTGTINSDSTIPFPIKGAELMLFSGTQTSATFKGFCTTDSSGKYKMENVPDGTYFMVIHRDGFTDKIQAPFIVSQGQSVVQNANLNSETGYGKVELTITDKATGSAIQGDVRAYIMAPDEDDEPAGFLSGPDANGKFSSYFLPGSYTLIGSARGYKPFTEDITITNGQTLIKTAELNSRVNAIVAGVNWLIDQQNSDGSFGEQSNDNPYIMGWSGYATLALLSIKDNPDLALDTALKNKISNALDDEQASDGKKGAKQYFLSLYHDADNAATPWNDVGAFYDTTMIWSPVVATPVALESIIALGLPLNDPKVSAAANFLLKAQVTLPKAKASMFTGGWRYSPSDTDADNWETPWVIMALMKTGLNPYLPSVKAGIDFIKSSQFKTGEDAGLFRYMPGNNWPASEASAACITALGLSGVQRADTAVDLYFQWAKNHPYEIHANNGAASDCYYWSMLAWASSLYSDTTTSGKTEYDTLELTWNIADYIYISQNQDGSWNNPSPTTTGFQSADSVMFTASALMALAPHTAVLAPPATKTVSGVISGPDGTVLANARVNALLNNIVVATTITNTKGQYQLTVPTGQSYKLMAAYKGYARVSLTTAAVTGDLTLQNISFSTSDKDTTIPTGGTFVPSNGSILENAVPQISALLKDDHSGIDPDTIVMELDGIEVYAVYDINSGELTMSPVPADMKNGDHIVTINFKDFAQNQASVSWSFKMDIWNKIHGDINNNGAVELSDAISALKILTEQTPSVTPHVQADINDDKNLGMAEAAYIIEKAAGLRQ